jgi:hypothetical protein
MERAACSGEAYGEFGAFFSLIEAASALKNPQRCGKFLER